MKLRIAILAVCMLVTGSLNTIATKLQDNVIVGYDEQGNPLRFRHPTFQTAAMFLGEMLCLVPFLLRRWYKAATRSTPLSREEAAARDHRLRRSFWVFSLPAMCDAAASTMLNLGLFFTYASVFQMLRGTLVIFAGLLTIVLLHRSLYSHHWLGMVLICAGAALVGASSIIYNDQAQPNPSQDHSQPPALHALAEHLFGSSGGGGGGVVARRLLMLDGVVGKGHKGAGGGGTAPNPLLGNILVVLAQLLAALQFIVEEKYLVKYRAPVLLAVGMEGFWGVVLCCAALPAMQWVRGADGRPLDSIVDAIAEVRGNWTLQWTTAITVTSIAFFNFFGVSVTKNLSGAARATIDACRTLFIWLFALRMGWEHFHMLQVVGFVVLLSGTSVYNEILRACLPAAEPRRRRHRSHHHHHAATRAAGGAEEDLQEPLLLGPSDFAAERGAQAQKNGSGGVAVAAEVGQLSPEAAASRPIAAGRQRGASASSARYTMARSVTILPQALSPHSLASVPSITFGGASFTFSVPHNLAQGGAGPLGTSYGTSVYGTPLGRGGLDDDEEGEAGAGDGAEDGGGFSGSESELSASDTGGLSSRENSVHGQNSWAGGRGRGGRGGGHAGAGRQAPPPPSPPAAPQ